MESITLDIDNGSKGDADMKKIGWIVVGIMGSRVSKHLLGKDAELYVLQRPKI